MRSSSRVQQLDILRALAIFLVIGRHMPPFERGFPPFMQGFCKYWIQCGWTGVDLFFVLSGFLISGLLFREYAQHRRISFGRFFTRRGFKIYPSFWVYLAGVLYVQISNGNYNEVTWPRVLSDVFFVANYHQGLLDHTWSLGVEEHFYILLPLLLAVTAYFARGLDGRRAFAWLPWFCLAVGVTLLGLRWLNARQHGYEDRTHLFPTHLRIDSLLFGVLLSYYYHFCREGTMAAVRRWRWPLLVVALGLMATALKYNTWDFVMHTAGLTGLYVGSGLLLLVSLTIPLPTRGAWSVPFRAVGFVGAHSYAIYLWHMPMKCWGTVYYTRWTGWTTGHVGELVIYVVGSLVVGIGLSMLVEVPTLALRDWLFPSRGKPLSAGEAAEAQEASPAAAAADDQEGDRASGPEGRIEVPA